MNIIRDNSLKNHSKSIGFFLAVFILIFASSCLEGIKGQKSGRPIGTQQILVTAFPAAVFGNACEFVDIQALFNELLTPDGATIQAALTGSTLPFNLSGCITFFDPVVVDGMADGEYLSPPLIGVGNLGFVNVAVTSTLQSDISASNFTTLVIEGVGIISITGPDMITSDPDIFATIQVETFGIPPGTVINFQLTNNSCGFLTNATPVLGSVFEGIAIVQYNPVEATECSQTVIATIILPDPPTKDPNCPSIPVADRTIQAAITFNQVVAPVPTPTPSPAPSPTPPPVEPTIEVTAFNQTIAPDGSTIITATVNTGPNTDVCCDIPIQSSPPSVLDSMVPDCGVTDINGEFFSVLTAGPVVTLQTIQVRCCIDSNTVSGACDPEEPQDSVFVDINPAGVPPPITLTASPSTIPPGGTSTITASTTPPVFPGEICFDIVINSVTDPSMLFNTGPPFCFDTNSLGQAVVGLQGGNVTTQEAVTVRGCINEDPLDDMCDPADPSNFVTVPIVPPAPTPTPGPTPPPAPAITIQATNSLVPPNGNTFINVMTNQVAGTELCVQILVDGTTGGSTISGPTGGPITACAPADAGGDSIGVINLTISGTAMSGQQISLQGCIDNSGTMDVCDDTDPLSSVIFVTVQ